MSKRIAVIIVSFGRSRLLATTLESLMTTIDRKLCDITVVDNGSGEETIGVLMQYRDRIDNLVLLNENRGKPYAWNLGARMACERCVKLGIQAPDYYLFCDNDLRFLPNWSTQLLTTYKEHTAIDQKLCGLSGLCWPRREDDIRKGPTTSISVYRFPPGCCVLMSKEAFAANGSWDTKRLIRTVDTSYFRNAIRRGWRNAAVHPKSFIETTGGKMRSWNIRNGDPKLFA